MQDLERQLKATCEAFIMHVTKLVVEPMLSFITKVTAVKVTQQGAEAARPLREQVRRWGSRGLCGRCHAPAGLPASQPGLAGGQGLG